MPNEPTVMDVLDYYIPKGWYFASATNDSRHGNHWVIVLKDPRRSSQYPVAWQTEVHGVGMTFDQALHAAVAEIEAQSSESPTHQEADLVDDYHVPSVVRE